MRVNLGKDSYDIIIKQGALNQVLDYIQPLFKGSKIMIISDDHVYPIYGENIKKQLEQNYTVGNIVLPHGEKTKRFDILPSIYSQLLSFNLTRTDLIIALMQTSLYKGSDGIAWTDMIIAFFNCSRILFSMTKQPRFLMIPYFLGFKRLVN